MRKFVVISDSFKGTLSSQEICKIARETIQTMFSDSEVVTIPVADGGEGTVDCFIEAIHAESVSLTATGPLGEPVVASYARKGQSAIVEMAATAGLPLAGNRLAPERATTYGVGEVIRHAVEHGAKDIILGLGGSATNDGGCGCAAALGARFLDKQGKAFIPCGNTLDRIEHIDLSEAQYFLENVHITVMCDVENPLYGPDGAAYVFAPQKGADPSLVERLDRQLRALDKCLERELNISIAEIPGSGAAGGMGGGCVAFLGATLKSGIEVVLDAVNFDTLAADADLVITGEGQIDAQSARGKVISGISKRTILKKTPLIALVGSVGEGADALYDLGVSAIFSINQKAEDFSVSASHSGKNYRKTLENILRLIQTLRKR